MLAAALALQSCSNSYAVLAKVIDGRLAFVSDDSGFDCISIIRVSEEGPRAPDPAIDAIEDPVRRGEAISRARAAWVADGVSFSCQAHFPVFYGSHLPEMPVLVPAKKLRVGQAYSVSVMGPEASGGDGCFRMTKEGRAENLPEQECSYFEPLPQPPPPPPATIVAPAVPRADPQSYIRAEDYPESSLRFGEQGKVRFALDLGVDGRVGSCTVARSSGAPTLDGTTCRIMRSRARFTPARDINGNPAASRIEQEVTWTRPAGRSAAPPEVEQRGYGMISHSLPAEPVVITNSSPIPNEPIMAIPQRGPGPAELSVWTPGSDRIPTLGKYKSIPACRKALAKLKLRPGQKAYCTLAPKKYRDWGIH